MRPPVLREAVFGDYAQISGLETSMGLLAKPYEEWVHLWKENPAFKALRRWPIGWVLEAEHGRVVGYLGNIPLFYRLLGRRLLTASGRGLAVDPGYRPFGLLLLETYFEQAGVDLFLNTTVNDRAEQALSVFNAVRVPKGDWDRAGFWITNHLGFARSATRMKRLPASLAYPMAAALKLKSLVHGCQNAAAIRIDTCAVFDERFEKFWERLQCERRNVLMGERAAETLEWHFRYPLRRRELLIGSVSDESGLAAYAVFVRRDVPAIGLRRARLADFQQLGGGASLLSGFLAWATARYRTEGVHAVEVVGCGAAPYHRRLPAWCFYYRPGDPKLAEQLASPDVWDPSSFDGDSSL